MNKTVGFHSAYPCVPDAKFASGLTKRELFAAMAMQGLLSNPSIIAPNVLNGWSIVNATMSQVSNYATCWADDLIAALNQEKQDAPTTS